MYDLASSFLLCLSFRVRERFSEPPGFILKRRTIRLTLSIPQGDVLPKGDLIQAWRCSGSNKTIYGTVTCLESLLGGLEAPKRER